MKRRILILLVISMLAFGACAQPTSTPSTVRQEETPTQIPEPIIPVHFITYTDDSSFFSISYPPDWEPFPSRLEEMIPISKDLFKGYDSDVSLAGLFFVFYAELPAEPDATNPNMNIVVQSLSDMISRGWVTLDEIVEAKLLRTEEIKQDYHEFSRFNTIIGGREAVVIDWGDSYPDLDKKARSVQMFMIADNLLWKVTCYADSEKFNDFEDDLHAIVRSLRILK